MTDDKKLLLVKQQLTGANFRKLLKQKNITKYQLTKDTGISYQTFCMWQAEKNVPSDDLAELVGIHLGLIKSKDRIVQLKKEVKSLLTQIEALEKGG
jgi:transcriptional regulator with XRE-family HTH domain